MIRPRRIPSHPNPAYARPWWALVLCVGLASCSSAGRLEVLEAIQTAEETRRLDADFWERQLVHASSADERRRAALAVGRLREPALAQLLHRALEVEQAEDVRAELLFALGQMKARRSLDVLTTWLDDGEASERARAAEALGKLGDRTVVPALMAHVADGDGDVRASVCFALARLLGRRTEVPPSLDAPTQERLVSALAGLATSNDRRARMSACYALSEIDVPGRAEWLHRALASEDADVRLFAARGLSRVDASELTSTICGSLVEALGDDNVHVAASAATALGTSASPDVIDALVLACDRTRERAEFHVRIGAVAALAAMPDARDDLRIHDALRAALRDGVFSVRRAAFSALATIDAEGVVPTFQHWSTSSDPWEVAAAAATAGQLPYERVGLRLLELTEHDDPRVRAPALTSLASISRARDEARSRALAALETDDLAVRSTGLEVLATVGLRDDLAAVRTAFVASPGPSWVEARLQAVSTARTVADEEAEEFLRIAAKDSSRAVRLRAAEMLGELRLDPPVDSRDQAPPTSTLVVGRDVFASGARPRMVLETTRGVLTLELFRESAPHHVASALSFAREGRYDGLPFHRVVSGFVVQGLDPRGDGWGTGGVHLRDEIHPARYERGTVGMPNAGPDTGGCQLFITHVPTPHLDGRYTVFGRVIDGWEVLDALDVGDVCLEVSVR